MVFPLHLGVTEAGNGDGGRIKSAVGISVLLSEGIGDTIRVSLTEKPENEIPVAKQIVEAYKNMPFESNGEEVALKTVFPAQFRSPAKKANTHICRKL